MLSGIGDQWLRGTDPRPSALATEMEMITEVFFQHGRILGAVAETAPYDVRVGDRYQQLAEGFITATEQRIAAEMRSGRCWVPNPRELARALTWMDERYLLESFAHRPSPIDAPWHRPSHSSGPGRSTARLRSPHPHRAALTGSEPRHR